jgi:hypothetical protein
MPLFKRLPPHRRIPAKFPAGFPLSAESIKSGAGRKDIGYHISSFSNPVAGRHDGFGPPFNADGHGRSCGFGRMIG